MSWGCQFKKLLRKHILYAETLLLLTGFHRGGQEALHGLALEADLGALKINP